MIRKKIRLNLPLIPSHIVQHRENNTYHSYQEQLSASTYPYLYDHTLMPKMRIREDKGVTEEDEPRVFSFSFLCSFFSAAFTFSP